MAKTQIFDVFTLEPAELCKVSDRPNGKIFCMYVSTHLRRVLTKM